MRLVLVLLMRVATSRATAPKEMEVSTEGLDVLCGGDGKEVTIVVDSAAGAF